jgi:hypothetical protein
MTLNTPPRPHDILKVVPGLAEHAKPATRLHPREGAPGAEQSSVGGPLLWPVDEPWPVCGLAHEDAVIEPFEPALRNRFEVHQWDWVHGSDFAAQMQHSAEIALDLVRGANPDFDPDAPVPLIPLAQLYYRDVPGLPWSEKFDLLQILWCPRDHTDTETDASCCPAFQVFWRKAEAVTTVLTAPPLPDLGLERYTPKPCVVSPEVVTEYPNYHTLPEALKIHIDEWEERLGDDTAYSFDTAHAPGWKVMGYGMYWGIWDPYPMTCACGAEQLPLFTVDTGENSGGMESWQPIEEAGAEESYEGPVGVSIGRGYALQLYYCPVSEHHTGRSEMA